jgi:hypothetical protein
VSPAARTEAGRWGSRRLGGGPTWVRVVVIVAILGVAFAVAQTCQQSQIRLTKEQAIEKAERQVDFEPESTQIRLLRQGLTSEPFWIVSLSVPGKREGTFRELAIVKIDANSGKVDSVRNGR